ncbi:unnamed protein product [Staurois parvus]|uniref:Uncharacterized protein n=1 Tax=Staurois parvus TaxID=386267 RepID=A0ABN9G4H0_9NEOB|nr:unnamed protein product [Staurois parvus]
MTDNEVEEEPRKSADVIALLTVRKSADYSFRQKICR